MPHKCERCSRVIPWNRKRCVRHSRVTPKPTEKVDNEEDNQ